MTKIANYPNATVNDNIRLLATDTDNGNNTVNVELSKLFKSDVALPSVLNFFDFENGLTSAAAQDAWIPLVAETTQGFKRNGIALVDTGSPTTTKVVYNGEVPKFFKVSFIGAFVAASGRKIHLAIFKKKNGDTESSLWPCSEFAQPVPPSGDEVTVPGQCVVPLEQGDEIEVYIKCSTHALSVTTDNINVIIEQY